MEQTHNTPAFTPAGMVDLRRNMQFRLVVQAEALLRDIENLDAPSTALEITRRANAAVAVAKLMDKVLPQPDEEPGEPDADAQAAAPAPVMNRHQRRKAEAKARRAVPISKRDYPGSAHRGSGGSSHPS